MTGIARIVIIIGCYILLCVCMYSACFYQIAITFKCCYLNIMNNCYKNKITNSKIVPTYSISVEYNKNPYHNEIIV